MQFSKVHTITIEFQTGTCAENQQQRYKIGLFVWLHLLFCQIFQGPAGAAGLHSLHSCSTTPARI